MPFQGKNLTTITVRMNSKDPQILRPVHHLGACHHILGHFVVRYCDCAIVADASPVDQKLFECVKIRYVTIFELHRIENMDRIYEGVKIDNTQERLKLKWKGLLLMSRKIKATSARGSETLLLFLAAAA